MNSTPSTQPCRNTVSPILIIALLASIGVLLVALVKRAVTSAAQNTTLIQRWSANQNLPSCDQQQQFLTHHSGVATPSGQIMVVNQAGKVVSTLSLKNKQLIQQTTDNAVKPYIDQLLHQLSATSSSYQLGVVCRENNRAVIKQVTIPTSPGQADYTNLVISKLDAILSKQPYTIHWSASSP